MTCVHYVSEHVFTVSPVYVSSAQTVGRELGNRFEVKVMKTSFGMFLALGVIAISSAQHSARTLQTTEDQKAQAAIRAVLDAQRDAWNRGDLEGYMDGYDRSPNTEFVGGDTITRGWQTVLDRYRRNYNSREKMGTLTFSDLEITVLSKDAALVLGRWHLKRANDEPHGTFTLLFRKTKAGWKIVHDHSSSA